MARLRDLPHVYRNVGPVTFAKRIYLQTFEDNLLVWAAALAYSWLLALFPFLIFCLSLVPLLPDRLKPSEQAILQTIEEALVTGEPISEAADEIAEEMASPEEEVEDPALNAPGDAVPTTIPAPDDDGPTTAPSTRPEGDGGADEDLSAAEESAIARVEEIAEELGDEPADAEEAEEERRPAIISQTITSLVTDLINTPPTTTSLVTYVVLALFLASGGVAMTMAGLDECYDVASDKIRPLWKSRPMAMLLTIILSALILTTVVILPIGGLFITSLGDWVAAQIGLELSWLIVLLSRLLRWTLGLFLLLVSVGVLYKLGPSVKTRLHLFSPGTIFTVAMWVATAIGFQFYITSFGAADSYARTYGAVAGVAILMFLFYVDALFLLIGAEINAEIDFIRLGIKSGPLPENRQTAPVPPYQLDDEDRELKAELEQRRSVDVKPARGSHEQ